MRPVPACIALLIAACCATASAQSLTLSPAVVPLGGQPGHSTKQRLTLFNGTSRTLAFDLKAKDIVVRDGKRVFVEAGDIAGSIAASAVFSVPRVSLRPGEERNVDVTLTLPRRVTHRAVVILFQGTTRIGNLGSVSIGSLLTFELPGLLSITPGELRARPPTASTNAELAVPVTNDGSEPMIVRAAAAIIAPSGVLIGKLSLEPRRLLPGEHTILSTDYPGELAPGAYRVVATVESSKRSWTRTAELVVP